MKTEVTEVRSDEIELNADDVEQKWTVNAGGWSATVEAADEFDAVDKFFEYVRDEMEGILSIEEADADAAVDY